LLALAGCGRFPSIAERLWDAMLRLPRFAIMRTAPPVAMVPPLGTGGTHDTSRADMR